MNRALSWETDGRDWPNREASRFVDAGGLRWHVQVAGEGPAVLLIHGTGAATHSWRALIPLLREDFTVIAPDLPGHGFTAAAQPDGYALPRVARAVAALLERLGQRPVVVAGHSAGAAILARMCLDGMVAPAALVSLNGALLPMPLVPTDLFAPLARLFAGSALASRAFAMLAGGEGGAARFIRSSGSTIDAEGLRLYGRLAANPAHVAGAMSLMAHWDLRPLARDLPRLATPLVLLTGSADRMVPPSESYRVRSLVPSAELVSFPGCGHLAHEERAGETADLLRRYTPRTAGSAARS